MLTSQAIFSEGETGVVDEIQSKTIESWLKVVRDRYHQKKFSADQLRIHLGYPKGNFWTTYKILGEREGDVDDWELIKRAYEFASDPATRPARRGPKTKKPLPLNYLKDTSPTVTTPITQLVKSRRDELPVYKRGAGGAQVPAWTGLAAGFGEELERAPSIAVTGVLSHRDPNAITIRGDSMEPTLHAGDVILVETFNGGVELPPLDRDEPKNSLRKFKSFVQDDGIYVLQINGAGPTVKRIQFDVAESEVDWAMLVIPDNLRGYRVRAIKRSDHVVVLARVIGLVEGAA